MIRANGLARSARHWRAIYPPAQYQRRLRQPRQRPPHPARVVQQLRNVNATIAGVVLNDVDIERASTKDYYYAGYYYSSEDSDEAKSRPRGAGEQVETVGV